ncbi:hypothetical protein CYMTET_36569 [Cymbomonas tetramitiformis]|uniref:Gfo/Idh/MocA-like oxidoreductase N-terminal domain-containing protein n=1 Tax=Cymbomonas tetramitiformis TaxID=36881 RepID=A0AAE0F6V9_9CHLO|nr:hypothetical protein CYMTET_36569 [Cymbomonas tetramitiformis]
MSTQESAIRVGVIGAGSFASRRHCPDIIAHPKAQLTALCRRNDIELQKMAGAFAVEHTYTDHSQLLTSRLVDAVLVSSPHNLHYEHTKAALENGLHVLLEKPLCLDSRDARRLVELASSRNLRLLVAHNPPYWRHCRHLREQFQGGRLGNLEAASLTAVGNFLGVLAREPLPDKIPGVVAPTLYRGDPLQNGGGYLMDGGPHLLCELLWCTGRHVAEVSAQVDDAAFELRYVLTLRMDNGALVTVSQVANSNSRSKRQHNVYFGSKGTATVRGFPFTVEYDVEGSTRGHTVARSDHPISQKGLRLPLICS